MITRPEEQREAFPRGWWADDLTLEDIRPLLDNFATKFEPGTPEQCWEWAGGRTAAGYGILGRSYRAALLAHRVSWVAFTGQSLTGQLTIDHLCFNRLCVNPSHLEPVTLAENQRRKHERQQAERPVDWAPQRKRRTICEPCGKSLLVSSMTYHVTSAPHLRAVAA